MARRTLNIHVLNCILPSPFEFVRSGENFHNKGTFSIGRHFYIPFHLMTFLNGGAFSMETQHTATAFRNWKHSQGELSVLNTKLVNLLILCNHCTAMHIGSLSPPKRAFYYGKFMIHLQGLQPLDPSTCWAQITGISNVTTSVLATAYALKVSHAWGINRAERLPCCPSSRPTTTRP